MRFNRLLRNLRIKNKLLLQPFLATAAFLLILLVFLFLQARIGALTIGIETVFYPSLEVSQDLEQKLRVMQRSLKDAVATEDEDAILEADEIHRQLLDLMIIQNNQILGHLKDDYLAYYELARNTTLRMIAGETDEALTHDLKIMTNKYNAITHLLSAETQRNKKEMAAAFAETRKHLRDSLVVIAAVTLLCILLLGLLSIVLTNLISIPLKSVVAVAHHLSRGRIDVDLQIDAKDELGDLALVFSNLAENTKRLATAAIAIGHGDYSVLMPVRSDDDSLGNALNLMRHNLQTSSKKIEAQTWLKTGLTDLNNTMRGEHDVSTLAQNIISYVCKFLNAPIGALYMVNESDASQIGMIASHAHLAAAGVTTSFGFGEGLVGQAVFEKKGIVTTKIPATYLNVRSGLGTATPHYIHIIPFLFENEVKGVLEIGAFEPVTSLQQEFLLQTTESIGIAFNTVQSFVHTEELLHKTQRQADELQHRQAELKQSNQELEKQTQALTASQERLHTQQEELRKTNEELAQQAGRLEQQKNQIDHKNKELELRQTEIEAQSQQLKLANKYKSEFLANMSHELRTPLNSLLILSNILAENKDNNLSARQVDFAKTIASAGTDLLRLINDILDLSKVEAGKIELHLEKVYINDMIANMERNFNPIAEKKGLEFRIDRKDGIPDYIFTDGQRVEQIIKNLLSNAFKFTSTGAVTLSCFLGGEPDRVALAVTDSGIGIPEEKQEEIFEAFKQADGSTQRRYGGTGLGLSISKELAHFLEGKLRLKSIKQVGSTFTLYLPFRHSQTKIATLDTAPIDNGSSRSENAHPTLALNHPDPPSESTVPPEGRILLIIEDDKPFVKILSDLAMQKGFYPLVAQDGRSGVESAIQHRPAAIVLDIGLPEWDGWAVMERLKRNPKTRHIPVHFISGSDDRLHALKMGAIGFLQKPISLTSLETAFSKIEETISQTVKSVLVVGGDDHQQNEILQLVGGDTVAMTLARSGQDAHGHLQERRFDCVILEMNLADMSGFDFLELVEQDATLIKPPIIVYTSDELDSDLKTRLRNYTEGNLVKSVKSPERLLEEVTLFLHQLEQTLPAEKQQMLKVAHDKQSIFQNKKVLLADDDMRNVFALSAALENLDMEILIAKNGREALNKLDEQPDVDLILMDIMMPEMDGYEAMREIRKQRRFDRVPIIAATAKAMKGDRQKCIDAGANDYISKPIDTEQLLSLIRVWLYQ